MSDHWKVGDLAVCVDARQNPNRITPLVEGRIYRVERVAHQPHHNSVFGHVEVTLEIEGVTTDAPFGFAAERFRKIRPDEQKGEREDWQLLLDTMKPAKTLVPDGKE